MDNEQTKNQTARDERLIRMPEVEHRTGLKKSSIYLAMAATEAAFPPPVKIGRRAVAWRLGDVIEWINSRTSKGGA